MENNSKTEVINKKLISSFGLNQYREPNYRVVFSDNQFELRSGTFNEFRGKIFVRQTTGIKKCKKYPWIKEKFLIEKYFCPENSFNEAIIDSARGAYEPIYIFEDKDRNYLEPNEKVAIMVCSIDRNPIGYWKTKELLDEIEKEKEKRELNAVDEYFDLTPVGLALRMGEGIIVPGDIND